MLRRIGNGKDNFDGRIKRGKMQVVEIRAHIEVKLVVSGDERMVAEQRRRAAVAVGKGGADLVPGAACRMVAKLKELDRNIRRGTAERSIEDVGRDSQIGRAHV